MSSVQNEILEKLYKNQDKILEFIGFEQRKNENVKILLDILSIKDSEIKEIELEKFIELNKENKDLLKLAYYVKADIFEEKNEFNKAIYNLNLALKIDPTFTPAYYNLGVILNRIGKYDEARIAYENSVRLSPQRTDAYHNLAKLIIDHYRKEYEIAIGYLIKALELNPNFKEAYIGLGYIYANIIKDDKKAIEFYQTAIKIDPNFSDALVNIGAIYLSNNELELANSSLLKAIQLDAINPEVKAEAYKKLYYLYLLYFETNHKEEDYNKAKEFYIKSITLNPKNRTESLDKEFRV